MHTQKSLINDQSEGKYSPFIPHGNQIIFLQVRYYKEHDSPDFHSTYSPISRETVKTGLLFYLPRLSFGFSLKIFSYIIITRLLLLPDPLHIHLNLSCSYDVLTSNLVHPGHSQ